MLLPTIDHHSWFEKLKFANVTYPSLNATLESECTSGFYSIKVFISKRSKTQPLAISFDKRTAEDNKIILLHTYMLMENIIIIYFIFICLNLVQVYLFNSVSAQFISSFSFRIAHWTVNEKMQIPLLPLKLLGS